MSSADSVQTTDDGHPVDALARHVAVEDVRQLDVRHFAAAENARHRLADGAESEQRHARGAATAFPFDVTSDSVRQ